MGGTVLGLCRLSKRGGLKQAKPPPFHIYTHTHTPGDAHTSAKLTYDTLAHSHMHIHTHQRTLLRKIPFGRNENEQKKN